MTSWETSATQNSQLPKGESLIGSWGSYNPKSGNTLPGPIRLGAVALATITAVDPMICARHRVAATCTLLRVCNKIIPRPTPWIASRTPSQSHNDATVKKIWVALSECEHHFMLTYFRDRDLRLQPMEYREQHCWYPITSGTTLVHLVQPQRWEVARCAVLTSDWGPTWSPEGIVIISARCSPPKVKPCYVPPKRQWRKWPQGRR